MIADLFADYMLAVFVVAGLIACTLLGLALGCQGLTIAVRAAHRAGKRARAAVRERDKARGEKALALAQRDDAMRQLALADAALAEASHPVQHSGDLPEQDPRIDALVRAVTGDDPGHCSTCGLGAHESLTDDAGQCRHISRPWRDERDDDAPHGAHHRPEQDAETWLFEEQA